MLMIENREEMKIQINRESLDKKIYDSIRKNEVHNSQVYRLDIERGNHYYYKYHFYEFMSTYDFRMHQGKHTEGDGVGSGDGGYYRVVGEGYDDNHIDIDSMYN